MEAERLTVVAGDGTVLVHQLELSFLRSDRVALLGPSGSGKSTILEALAGCSPHRVSGPLDWHGTGIPPVLAVQEAGEAFSPYRGIGSQLLDSAPEDPVAYEKLFQQIAVELGLEAQTVWRMRAWELSVGMLKRVLLAGVLALRRPWTLLDEPTAGLDPSLRWAAWKCIHDFGRNVVVCTHDRSLLQASPVWRITELTGREGHPASQLFSQRGDHA
jgi:ATP-binding cassette subfamily C protein CydD